MDSSAAGPIALKCHGWRARKVADRRRWASLQAPAPLPRLRIVQIIIPSPARFLRPLPVPPPLDNPSFALRLADKRTFAAMPTRLGRQNQSRIIF